MGGKGKLEGSRLENDWTGNVVLDRVGEGNAYTAVEPKEAIVFQDMNKGFEHAARAIRGACLEPDLGLSARGWRRGKQQRIAFKGDIP